MSSMNSEMESAASTSPGVSRYDHFNAGLIASIIVFGFIVLSLAVIWLFGGGPDFRFTQAMPWPDVVGDEEAVADQPGFDEFIKGSEDLQSSLDSIEQAISRVKSIDVSKGNDQGSTTGRIPGPVPGPPNPIPTEAVAKRWKLSFEVESIEQYKRQLDHFGIEICVVHPTEQNVWRLTELGSSVSVTESDRKTENKLKSVFFAHVKPVLKNWDRKIIKDAGIDSDGKLVIQMFPRQLVAQVLQLEQEKLEELGRKLEEVSQTRIQLERSGEHFSIFISGIEFH